MLDANLIPESPMSTDPSLRSSDPPHPHTTHPELVRMANQIALFFDSQTPDEPALAAQALAGHLKLFWAPTMRQELVDQFQRGEGDEALPLVAAAVREHGDQLLTPGARVPGQAGEVFPKGGGDAG
jgi:formate dehydrogenase subunit delta